MDNLGAVVGGILAFVLLGVAELPLSTVLLLSIVPGLVSTAVAALAVSDRRPDPKPVSEPGEESSRASLPRPVRRLLLVTALFGLGASADSFLMAHLTTLGLPLALVPVAWISLQLGKSLLNAPGGALADRVGHRPVLAASFAVYALAYALFPIARSPWAFWALLPIYALHYGLGEGAEKALLAELCPTSARGRAFGLREAISGAALLPANVAFGWLYQARPFFAFAFSATFSAVAGIALLALVPRPGEDAARQSAMSRL
jgi:MFS family permease